MTIQSEVSKAGPFTGNGAQTVFPFGFRVFTGTEVSVYIDSVLQETGYSVVLETVGGSVTLETPLATGSTLAIIRNVEFNQLTDLESGQAFFPETLERAYDKLTMQTQQLKEGLGRAVIVSPDDTVTDPASLLLSIAEAQANAAASAASAAESETAAGVSRTAAGVSEANAAASATKAESLATTALRHMFEVFYSLSTETPPGAYPLHTGELIANCEALFPAFWAKAQTLAASGAIRTVDQTTYDLEVATYGETGAFVIDTVAKSIRLPKITRFLSSLDTLSEIGMPVGDAIRNITGSKAFHGYVVTAGTNGVFTGGGTSSSVVPTANLTATGRDILSFDASLQVPTAAENRPKHVRAALYIQVYTAVIPASEVQAAQFVGTLVGKADIDLTNVSPVGKANAAGWVMPDFSQPTTRTINTLYYADVDMWGYLSVGSAAGTLNIYADSGGITLIAAVGTSSAITHYEFMPLPKGIYFKGTAGTLVTFQCKK